MHAIINVMHNYLSGSKQVSLKKTSEGLGIRLSNGQPPIYVTQVEPGIIITIYTLIVLLVSLDCGAIGSGAMLAGIQIGDTIVEINGKNCRELESTEVSRLLQLKSLIKNSPRKHKYTDTNIAVMNDQC